MKILISMTSKLLEWLLSRRPDITSVNEKVEKGKVCALLVGMQIGAATLKNSIKRPHVIESKTSI